jgi:hypothetical protein
MIKPSRPKFLIGDLVDYFGAIGIVTGLRWRPHEAEYEELLGFSSSNPEHRGQWYVQVEHGEARHLRCARN